MYALETLIFWAVLKRMQEKSLVLALATKAIWLATLGKNEQLFLN